MVFSLASLACSPHITLWFFVILADGQIIFMLQKVSQYHRTQPAELRLSKTKLSGLVLFGISNSYLALSWQSVTVQVAAGYLLLSCLEYFILLSAVQSSPFVE